MRVLIAPDKFKGSLSAAEVAQALARGCEQTGARTRLMPLADGGDGSVAAAIFAGAEQRTVTVRGPLGERHEAAYALDAHTAVVEVAGTCGIALLPPGRLEPLEASSYGLGEAISAALAHRPKRLVVALGGSASTDAGIGMLLALGARASDAQANLVAPNARGMLATASLDVTPARELLADTEIVIASDVNAPLTGQQGAAHVFAPQKGADAELVRELDTGLGRFAHLSDRPQVADEPGSGAAGGLGFALRLLGGHVRPGAQLFLDLLGFDQAATDADLIITGEGAFDDQSLMGKLPVAVARRSPGKSVHLVCGRNASTGTAGADVFNSVQALTDLTDRDTSTDPELSEQLLTRAGAHIVTAAQPG